MWLFDTMAGQEIINRHIGRDEYHAIGVCRAVVKAEHEYAARFTDSANRLCAEIQKHARKDGRVVCAGRAEMGKRPSPALLLPVNWLKLVLKDTIGKRTGGRVHSTDIISRF